MNAQGSRRRADCPVCGRTLKVRADGRLRKHDGPTGWTCAGSYAVVDDEETS